MFSEPNLLNRIIITIEANNTQVAKKVLHGSLLNQFNINKLINSYFNSYTINTNIYLEELILNLGEISLHDFNSLFPVRFNARLSQALNQYQINNQTDIENFIYYLHQQDSTSNPTETKKNSKITDINIKQLINQLTQAQKNWILLLAKSCLSEHSLQKLLATREPALLTAINRKLSESIITPQYQEEPVSSWQLILNALKYIQQHNTQEIPKPDTKIISRITTELNNSAINITSIIELFRHAVVNHIPLNNWLKQLWQTTPVSQRCKKYLSIEEYQSLSEHVITAKENNHNQYLTDDTQLSEPNLLPEQHLPRQISNAGILVLWPILPALFNQLGLLEKQKFIHHQAQFSAVILLDYLIWGTEKAPTDRKGLNHILCGFMADENIESMPIEPEKQLATEQWLDMVIAQLPAWKKLSRNDARQLFLQRPGELRINEQEIKITIQPQPFDALLTDWPWPLNIAKLPWLERPLLIDWQNI
ncbi:contractile injection system tape measure protein [Photorhabdus luminescens]|uniref:contractile injection system tape measure protein n=1 Tax=Photorhabdus luminescens TaxID=29488 RepID=UPI00223EA992|nr:contractile injection system tape measure protein [Photorhabdus luminescens]MCW7762595.1 contractile injection system tape measure protein [Photorhabdus luminescens subsp. venezuelensis]